MTAPRPPPATYGLTPDELFRLTTAYCAIRDPQTRSNILRTIEEWAKDQWEVVRHEP